MKAKEKMANVTGVVKAANAAIMRDMGTITLQDRMELLPDAQTRYELASAIKELQATLKELRKF
jgi:hypothetical protein